MKIDRQLNKAIFTPSQLFFLGCWYNMTNISSLDSYRVKTINPLNAIEEMSKMFNISISNNSDIEMVYSEAKHVLTSDPLLKLEHRFQETIIYLIEHLKKPAAEKKFQKNCTLTNSLLREAKHYVHENYINLCFDFFHNALVENAELSDQIKKDISLVTNNFLSLLINSGSSIDTLFNYYINILKNNKKNGSSPNFQSRLKLLKRIVTNNDNEYEIIFRLEFHNKELIDAFPNEIAEIRFLSDVSDVRSGTSFIDKILTSKYPTLKFAKLKLKAKDERHAGALAYEKIYSVIDLIRFEYISKPITILDEFICISTDENHKFRLLEVDKILQHPSSSLTEGRFEDFTSMVSKLVDNPQIPQNDKDQIFSAFKFYRIGGDTNINENRIINWWVAIEHLSQSNSSGSAIGEKVINTLLPVMCINYFRKHFEYLRRELADLEFEHNGQNIKIDEKSSLELYEILMQDFFLDHLKSHYTDEYFLIFKVEEIKSLLSSGKSINKAITDHKDRLKKQIYRIYRARCDIVHSNSAVISLSLLCSNLEFYLKQTLSFILKEIVEKPTLNSIEEILLRTNLTFGQLMETLNKEDFDKFKSLLK
ncbi:hypothetical protein [Rheinheimera faecalis]|uniref:hypothetical protein n=1 Tax=Rheinheimera faecalis TaxID=2901141 RepID=UPI001E36C1EC|nr:hypothetical protein [Rheinheimera faecalis]